MHSYTLIAPAKINLYLEILGDRPDGYHELAMILQSIELADRLELRANGTEKIRLHCSHPQVPLDQSNLAYKAAQLMQEKFPKTASNYGGMDLTIEKNTPVAAGLAGGSSNAAAVLVGINLMWELGLTQPELQELGSQLGSDVPFCISGGTAIATGRGELLDPIPDLDHLFVVLAKYQSIAVSTPWAYNTYRQQFGHNYVRDPRIMQAKAYKIHSNKLVKAIQEKDSKAIGKYLHNDLEKVVLPEFSLVNELRTEFAKQDVLGTMMSGSGPTVFALCESQKQAEKVKEAVKNQLSDPDLEFWITKLSNTGINVSC
jgi:4-diphosphocytidyl-2-C-methyl-D-erythritol kinase